VFTGIIQSVGHIAGRDLRAGDLRLSVASGSLEPRDLQLGESIAVNGVCLTVTELTVNGFRADVSLETLSRTLLAELKVGQAVNLERALLPTTRLGGHLVSGHVDGVGQIVDRRQDARSVRFEVGAPPALSRFIAEKGSICIDGASLTVNGVRGAEFQVNIVPHTLSHTIMGRYHPGTRVHLEVDLVARYLERLLLGERASDSQAAAVDPGQAPAMGNGEGGST
jgi:riboflavin synthase